MPERDTARDNAFSAVRNSRSRIVQICREAQTTSPSESTIHPDAIANLLAEHGFEVERQPGGVAGAYRATRIQHDAEAMRKGLRHAHVGFLIPFAIDDSGEARIGQLLGGGTVAASAIGLAATLSEEYATITVVIAPDDAQTLRSIAATGVFAETDVLLGARAVAPGQGFCYTINGTGDRLAELTVKPRSGYEALSLSEHAVGLSEYESSVIGEDQTIIVTAPTLTRAQEIVNTLLSTTDEDETDPDDRYDILDRTAEMIVSRILARRVKTYGDNLDLRMDRIRKTPPEAPTIWNNLSHLVPAYEMAYSVQESSDGAPIPDWTVSLTDESFDQMIHAAECLCFTGLDVVRDDSYRAIADDQLVKALRERGVERPHRRWLGLHKVMPKPVDQGGEPKKLDPG